VHKAAAEEDSVREMEVTEIAEVCPGQLCGPPDLAAPFSQARRHRFLGSALLRVFNQFGLNPDSFIRKISLPIHPIP
jgi:hypothetical protein